MSYMSKRLKVTTSR